MKIVYEDNPPKAIFGTIENYEDGFLYIRGNRKNDLLLINKDKIISITVMDGGKEDGPTIQ